MDKKTIIEKYEINPNQTLDVFYENGEVWCSDDDEWAVIHCGEMRVDYNEERLYTANDFIKVGLDTDDKVDEAEGNEELYWHICSNKISGYNIKRFGKRYLNSHIHF